MLVLFCLGVFLGSVKACVQLETYLEDGVFTKEFPEAKAQAWHKWLSALQTRSTTPLVEASRYYRLLQSSSSWLVQHFSNSRHDQTAGSRHCQCSVRVSAARESHSRPCCRRCYKNAFWFVTLLYPRCAQTSMQMFATQTLDVGTFLKADYSISTHTTGGGISSTYAVYLVFGTVLVIVFTLVLPIFYFYVIWRLRFRLQVSN